VAGTAGAIKEGEIMTLRVNPKWYDKQVETLAETGQLDITESFNGAIKEVIKLLDRRGKPFKLYNLGAGVKRITTDTDKCPCCKRNFKEGE
jgi:hypothetical protein